MNHGKLDQIDEELIRLVEEAHNPDEHSREVGGVHPHEVEPDVGPGKKRVRLRLLKIADYGYLEKTTGIRDVKPCNTYLPVDDDAEFCFECERRIASKKHPSLPKEEVCVECFGDLFPPAGSQQTRGDA